MYFGVDEGCRDIFVGCDDTHRAVFAVDGLSDKLAHPLHLFRV